MKWPLVSRETYDRHTQVLIDAQASLIQQNDWLRDHYEMLFDRLYPDASLPVASTPLPDRSPSLIDQVIREQAPTDPRLKAHLRSYASKLKRDGKSEGDIVLALTAWSTTEPLLTE